MSRLQHPRMARVAGALLITVGFGVLGFGLFQRWRAGNEATTRAQSDAGALNAWTHGGNSAVVGAPTTAAPVSPVSTPAASQSCGGASSLGDAYALVQFAGIGINRYDGVSVDGNWDKLHDRSMVHWHGSPDPGGQGNAIVAFHREPDYRNIDQLAAGGTITIQDRSCHMYVYTVSQRWNLLPGQVTQLVPTSGHDLTMITCDPWWQDYRRLVWRASLTSVDGKVV